MSMTLEASPSRAFSSSDLTRTYWSLATSYPLTRSLRSTTASSTGQTSCCRMRWPHVAWSRLNETPAEAAAVYSLIGMDTSPNEIIAEPSEWTGMTALLQVSKSERCWPLPRFLSRPTELLPMERARGQGREHERDVGPPSGT